VLAVAGEDHLRRGIGDGVEERIGREVVAEGAARRNPADGAGGDDGGEGAVRQAVTFGGAVEHRAFLWGVWVCGQSRSRWIRPVMAAAPRAVMNQPSASSTQRPHHNDQPQNPRSLEGAQASVWPRLSTGTTRSAA